MKAIFLVMLSIFISQSALSVKEEIALDNVRIQRIYEIHEPTVFKIESNCGSINFVGSEEENINVQFDSSAMAQNTKVEAFHEGDKFKLTIRRQNTVVNSAAMGDLSFGSIIVGGSGSITINGHRIVGDSVSINTGGIHLITSAAAPAINITVSVPRRYISHVELKNMNYPIQIHNLGSSDGIIRCETKNASITLQNVEGNSITANTSNAKLSARNCLGSVRLSTTNSTIYAENNTGSIDAKSTNGQITILGQKRGEVRASTSNSPIIFDNPEASGESGHTTNAGVQYTRAIASARERIEGGAAASPFDF